MRGGGGGWRSDLKKKKKKISRKKESEKKKERRTRLGYPTNSPSDRMSLRMKQTPQRSLEIAEDAEDQQQGKDESEAEFQGVELIHAACFLLRNE